MFFSSFKKFSALSIQILLLSHSLFLLLGPHLQICYYFFWSNFIFFNFFYYHSSTVVSFLPIPHYSPHLSHPHFPPLIPPHFGFVHVSPNSLYVLCPISSVLSFVSILFWILFTVLSFKSLIISWLCLICS